MLEKITLVAVPAVPEGTAIAMWQGYPVYIGNMNEVPQANIDEIFLHPSDIVRARHALKDRLRQGASDAMHVCNETYQVVAALADMADVFDDPAVTAVLDNLTDAANGNPLTHASVVPFYPAGWQDKIAIIRQDEIEAAAAWLRSDDNTYAIQPERSMRTARAMLSAAKMARWGQDDEG